MYNIRPYVFIAFCLLLAITSFAIGISFGAVHFSQNPLLMLWQGNQSFTFNTIIFSVRLPEISNAFVVGGLLCLAGILMQSLLQNPLADPYILGVSGGAAVATLIGLFFDLSTLYLHLLSYLGAFIAIIAVFTLARSPRHWSSEKLLLTGVVLAAGFGAIISFILSISPNSNLHGLLFWLVGNLNATQFSLWGFMVLLFGLIVCLCISKPLDLLLQGHTFASLLGVNLAQLFLILYLLSAFLTATSVSIAGTIGFVGLVVPHMVRLCIGSCHRFLILASVLLGGSLLILADTLARTLFQPLELPVGIFTVFIGVPMFLFLLLRKKP